MIARSSLAFIRGAVVVIIAVTVFCAERSAVGQKFVNASEFDIA
jgi:hypothetical protein